MACFSFNISLFFLYSTKKGPGGTFYNTVFHFIIIYYYINNIVAHTMKSCWLHLLCLVVVLPPLPGGEEGEIYDDVVDPNLEVRWELVLLFKKTGKCKRKDTLERFRKHDRRADHYILGWLSSPFDPRSSMKPRSFLRMFDRNRRPASAKV